MVKDGSQKQMWIPETKLEAKMVEAMQRREAEGCTIKSFNSLILKFPKIDENLRKCKDIFEEFGRNLSFFFVFPISTIHLAVVNTCD